MTGMSLIVVLDVAIEISDRGDGCLSPSKSSRIDSDFSGKNLTGTEMYGSLEPWL